MKPHRSAILHDPDAGLGATLEALAARETLSRRAVLGRLAGAGFLLSPLGTLAATCSVIPSETAGPFPADGSNGPNVLTQTGILRNDIRASFGASGTATATGVGLTITLRLTNTNADCAPLVGYAVYLWHCDASGRYSMYSPGVTTQNYLRGVQLTDSSGGVSFTSIFPGCYPGRWPHIHFEVYPSAALAVAGTNAVKTSQLALPEDICRAVYTGAAGIYPGSLANLNQVTLAGDNVFSDGVTLQMAEATGSVEAGIQASLQMGIAGSAVPVNGNAVTVEFYNSILDHYVMLTDPVEIASVDSGAAGPGWARTGARFEFEPPPGANSYTMHRFYGSLRPGPNSHFYTISEAEKAQLIAIAAATPSTSPRWNYEATGGFWAGITNLDGTCADTNGTSYYTVPVYRLYNDGFAFGLDSNHRYTSSFAIASQMRTQGWKLEGVAFCALAATVGN